MENKRSAEELSEGEPPPKQQRITQECFCAQPGPDFPEPSDLDMLQRGKVAVFQRAQLWSKIIDLSNNLRDLARENAQLHEYIATLNHVPRAAVYFLTEVHEDLSLTLKRAGIKPPDNIAESPVSAAILDPEVSAVELFEKMDAPLKPIKTLLAQIVHALEQHASTPDSKLIEEATSELHARIRKTSGSLERFSEREEQFRESLNAIQSELEDAKQNMERMRRHIVSLNHAASEAKKAHEDEAKEAEKEAVANGPEGIKRESVPEDKGDSKTELKVKMEQESKPDPEMHAEVERLQKLASERLEEIKVHVEEKKKLQTECEQMREEAEIREGGVLEVKEVLGSALYQTMEVTLEQLVIKEREWEKEREQLKESMREKQKSHDADIQELKDDYEERLKNTTRELEEMRGEKEKAKKEKDKWSMTYEARKLEQSKGRVVAACEARAELAEKLQKQVEERNKKLSDRISDLEKRLSAAENLVNSNSKVDKEEVVKGLQSELEEERGKSDEFMGEIESMSQMFSEVEAENGRLTKLLAEKEQILSKVMGERLKHRQALTTVKEQNKTMVGKLTVEADKLKALQAVLAATKKEVLDARNLTQKAKEESQLHAIQAEKRKRSANDLMVAARTAKSEKEELKKQVDAIKGRAESAMVEMESAKFDLKRTQEELTIAAQKLTTLESEQQKQGEPTTEDQVSLKDAMIAQLKRQLNCSVVTTERKQVVLLRCGHLFSRRCVDELIAGRNRKCPICGERFGQDDIRPIYLD